MRSFLEPLQEKQEKVEAGCRSNVGALCAAGPQALQKRKICPLERIIVHGSSEQCGYPAATLLQLHCCRQLVCALVLHKS
eukprot:1149064-Pelagomonas_calceolata.AAC.3